MVDRCLDEINDALRDVVLPALAVTFERFARVYPERVRATR
jgi:hypothetical protein